MGKEAKDGPGQSPGVPKKLSEPILPAQESGRSTFGFRRFVEALLQKRRTVFEKLAKHDQQGQDDK